MSVTTTLEVNADADTSGNCSSGPRTTPDLKYLNRVKTEIPVVKLGCEYATRLISGLRESSTVVEWSLNKASSSIEQVVNYPFPYVKDQLLIIDQMLCMSLDLTELNLPVLTKTPKEVFDESVEYVMGIVTPITDWVDVEILSPGEYYVDRYLPELDTDQELKHVDGEKGSRACQLAVKFTRRVIQHAHAEPKYIRNLLYTGYEELILIMKILIFDPKLMPRTFHQIWKKLGDGVTPDEEVNSLLLVEMGCIKLRIAVSKLVKIIEITEEMVFQYIELLMRFISTEKIDSVDSFSRNPTIENQTNNKKTQPQNENIKTKTMDENTNNEPSTSFT